ncbi:hypothetical protein [Paraburkholderia sp. BL9I2N2]|uniref:hypothetical protein n=1 Tax=Paraburkholderia sp. BL9I2N2 TaxID=1938809 RepID=UPI00104B66EC|nr:hypothetical protein [Paraburkholderia sp. BL9I2N2]TCK84306.1 hypothetical protein B0G74_9143 [Paraburkholderia sp. BL9I2N2]
MLDILQNLIFIGNNAYDEYTFVLWLNSNSDPHLHPIIVDQANPDKDGTITFVRRSIETDTSSCNSALPPRRRRLARVAT